MSINLGNRCALVPRFINKVMDLVKIAFYSVIIRGVVNNELFDLDVQRDGIHCRFGEA